MITVVPLAPALAPHAPSARITTEHFTFLASLTSPQEQGHTLQSLQLELETPCCEVERCARCPLARRGTTALSDSFSEDGGVLVFSLLEEWATFFTSPLEASLLADELYELLSSIFLREEQGGHRLGFDEAFVTLSTPKLTIDLLAGGSSAFILTLTTPCCNEWRWAEDHVGSCTGCGTPNFVMARSLEGKMLAVLTAWVELFHSPLEAVLAAAEFSQAIKELVEPGAGEL